MTVAVTLLLPNYNGARFLRESIPMLLSQTYGDFCIIVVDNNSTDDSEAVVSSFTDSRLRFIPHREHVPVWDNFKRAQALVETPFYATCAADELYEPAWLETMVRLLELQPDAFFACCKHDSADENGKLYLAPQEQYKDSFWPPGEPALFVKNKDAAVFLYGCYVTITMGVFRTSATHVIGPFDETYSASGDWEYLARGTLLGFSIIGTHQRLAHYRRHPHMTSCGIKQDLSRFHAELRLVNWLTEALWQQRLTVSSQPDYRALKNTMLHEFTLYLAKGDKMNAGKLLRFGVEHIPDFRWSLHNILANIARPFGKTGGQALQLIEGCYIKLRLIIYRRVCLR